ncbi:MAG: autotransporter outer membrane beta-barrel domain-containing protein [Paracoccaceae bacterium]
MDFARFFGTSRVIKPAFLAALFLSFTGLAQPVAAVSFVGGGDPPIDPQPTKPSGPGIPYISGRVGPARATAEPPTGNVVPDDFCLPGKFDDCGTHLRDAGDLSPVPVDGPLFVGRDNSAFAQARQGVWINGQSRQTDLNSGAEQRALTSFSVGGDRRVGEGFAIGAMVVSNNLTTDFTITGIRDAESGIQAGPYFAYRLSETLILDGRIVYGVSNHTVTMAGVTTGNYESQGGYGALRVSGTYDRGNWRLHPSLEFATLFQDSEFYLDTLRGPIAAGSASDTFATASILAYYNQLSLGNGTLDPYIGLEASQPISGGGNVFGTFRAGMAMTLGNGAILNFDFAHGAIGLSNTRDRLISLRLEIPL